MVREQPFRCAGLPALVATALGIAMLAAPPAAADEVDFSRDIQPLLAKRCFASSMTP